MRHVVLTVIGKDRPGLNREIAEAVQATGGNWLESHLGRLGGRYAGSVLLEIPAGAVGALEDRLREIAKGELEVRLVPAEARDAPRGEALRVTVVGQDRPGIVRQVSAALAALHVNIEEFKSRTESEPHLGGTLFRADLAVSLPKGVDRIQVQEALEALSGEIMVDLLVSP